jgi:hypothetical protein
MTRKRFILLSISLLCLVLAAGPALAAVQALEIGWFTVDGGGGTSGGGDYSLSGTIGQADAGVLSGGGYTLTGGLWNKAVTVPAERRLYLPMVNR